MNIIQHIKIKIAIKSSQIKNNKKKENIIIYLLINNN